jgi:hypothetical protein
MRAIINENVREIMEEMMGGNAQPQQTTMPTPGGQKPPIKGGKVGQPAQQVAAGVQATANQAAAAGDQKVQAQIAQQQGLDPAHAAQVNKTANAQPQPARANPTALARDRRNNNLVNKQEANAGQVIQPQESTMAQANLDFAEIDKLVAEDEGAAAKRKAIDQASDAHERATKVLNAAAAKAKKTNSPEDREAVKKAKRENDRAYNSYWKACGEKPPEMPVKEDTVDGESAGDDAASPDDKPDMNDDSALGRAKERAKEIHGKTGSEADFPGEKKEAKAAGYGKDGAGRPQGHHEVTHPGQRVARSTEKGEEKADEAVAETVYTDAERKTLLDGIFGA